MELDEFRRRNRGYAWTGDEVTDRIMAEPGLTMANLREEVARLREENQRLLNEKMQRLSGTEVVPRRPGGGVMDRPIPQTTCNSESAESPRPHRGRVQPAAGGVEGNPRHQPQRTRKADSGESPQGGPMSPQNVEWGDDVDYVSKRPAMVDAQWKLRAEKAEAEVARLREDWEEQNDRLVETQVERDRLREEWDALLGERQIVTAWKNEATRLREENEVLRAGLLRHAGLRYEDVLAEALRGDR